MPKHCKSLQLGLYLLVKKNKKNKLFCMFDFLFKCDSTRHPVGDGLVSLGSCSDIVMKLLQNYCQPYMNDTLFKPQTQKG